FAASPVGRLLVAAVGLVDRDEIRDLEDAALDALELVARAREHQDDEDVDHVGPRRLALADAHGLHEHDIEPGSPGEQQGLARLAAHPAERAAARRRAY